MAPQNPIYCYTPTNLTPLSSLSPSSLSLTHSLCLSLLLPLPFITLLVMICFFSEALEGCHHVLHRLLTGRLYKVLFVCGIGCNGALMCISNTRRNL